MKIKKFDCVEMKNELQEQLIKSVGGDSVKEYYIRLRDRTSSSELYKKIKGKSRTELLKQ